MNKKVSLREIVGTKIILRNHSCILLLDVGKNGLEDWYLTLQLVLGCFLAAFCISAMRIKKYKKEGIDEMAERNLKRCDSFCLKVLSLLWL